MKNSLQCSSHLYASTKSFRKLATLCFIVFILKNKEEEIQIIIQHWIRTLNIKLGWIKDFDKLVVNYVMSFLFFIKTLIKCIILFCYHFLTQTTTVFMLDTFSSSSKLLKTFTGHSARVYSIDCTTFDNMHFLCSGSTDNTVRVWDIENNKQIQSFNGHEDCTYCVKFSPYHHYNHSRNVICFSSDDKTIRFWHIKDNQQLKIYNERSTWIGGIEFSPFNSGRYLCFGSGDKTICLWDVETSKSLHSFNGHKNGVWCVNISPLQSNNNNDNKSNMIGVIGGNGYTICSGSCDKTIRIWDIETTKQLNVFNGHTEYVMSVKYGSNELVNTILSGSNDTSVCLWDIRSGQQIQEFNGHTMPVKVVEYSPFVVNNTEAGGSSNIVCSGSEDNTIRFWDVRSNKKELYTINGDNKRDCGISCFKFLQFKKKNRSNYCTNLFYGSQRGCICIWG
ncbi:WD-40 repeat protein [Reticulomyxa filosa]|uniref:WD-40 repeat protein n=1 Tax=Reticulomyxa filosa TaxID=46433 RepID=X6M543_RETFI|nr:WD-40 repeat protein [Reticulomyxa filosa]|eukprot:ETO08155.1 WD-40 repeat protein [Reticulomyxa filosa]